VKIPEKFENILKNDQDWEAVVKNIVRDFEPILEDNKLFFFEEYTDHSIKHIEMVLKAAEFLISDESFEYIQPKEVAILILAIVLHDIGMHTYFATFKAMIDGKYDNVSVDILDNQKSKKNENGKNTWKEWWLDYNSEAKHWSSKELNDIFGNSKEIPNGLDLPNKDKDQLTGADKKLIGEFIRRNHERLAYEMALKGFIGETGTIPFGNDKLNERNRKFVGIVARSHGMNIRDTFEYLKKKIGYDTAWKYPDGVNIVFLMVVLRIADYLQIDKTRSDHPNLLKLKTFNSPYSLKEHLMLLDIESLNFSVDDPELIYVTCNPKEAQMYVKIQNLINDIQHEFDLSWAILGEIYSFQPTEKPKIKFRRINSNLEHSEFLDSINYVPKKIVFTINNELAKLLVAPLYGDNPTYGVRELVQNATDACKERKKIEEDKENKSYDPLVTVSIDKINDKQYKFSIKDNGIGMTEDDIIRYFLSIGSSFRQSREYKEEFSSVNRNGRFGIGILAAFLLGDEITVKTKSYKKDTYAYTFKARFDSENIDIEKKLDNFDIGTIIEILMSYDKYKLLLKNKVHDRLSWTDWYIGEVPCVEYFLNKKKIQTHNYLYTLNYLCTRYFPAKNFGEIEWKYHWDYKFFKNAMYVVCNDIIITLQSKGSVFKYTDEKHIIVYKPCLKIEDPNSMLPLKLDRSDLDTNKLPFEEELLEDVSKNFIARLLKLPFNPNVIKNYLHDIFPHNIDFLFLKDGFILNSDHFINKISNKLNDFNLLEVMVDSGSIKNFSLIFNFERSDNFIISLNFYGDINRTLNSTGCTLTTKEKYNRIKYDLDKVTHKIKWERTGDYIFFNIENYKNRSNFFDDQDICISVMNNLGNNVWAIRELPFSCIPELKGEEILNKLFEKYFGDNYIIPYDMTEREERYKKAFYELEDYMK